MSIADHAPISFGLGTLLISKSSGKRSQHQCDKNGQLCASNVHQSLFLQVPGAVYIYNGGSKKVDRKGTSSRRISYLLRFTQPPRPTGSFAKKLDFRSPPFLTSYEQHTD